MNHYVYEITNNINGKKYIGKRSCNCIIVEDSYMGSGKLLLRAIGGYGIENFSKTVLHVANSQDEAYGKEFEIIESLKCYENHNNYYNIQHGGIGGWQGIKFSATHLKRMSNSHKGKNNYWYGKRLPYHTLKKASEVNKIRMLGEGNSFYGKTHTVETKNIIREKNKGENAWNTSLTETKVKEIKYLIYGQQMLLKDIAKGYGVGGRTISDIKNEVRWGWLKIYETNGDEINLKDLDYHQTSQRFRIYPTTHKGKDIICINNNKIFSSCKEACEYIGVSPSSLNGCLKKRQRTSGKINGQSAKWMYLEEYNNQQLTLTL